MFYCSGGAQSAQFPCISLYEVDKLKKQNLKILLIISIGSKNLAICKIVNFMLHTNLVHVWKVAHQFTTSRVLASKQVWILIPTTI